MTPISWHPYLRLVRIDRPIGVWLRLFPAWWAIALTGDGLSHAWLTAVLLVEAVVSRGLGCTSNDIIDRDIDSHVERTRTRPVASRQIPVPKALGFAVFQTLLGILVLALLHLVLALLHLAVLAIFAVSLVLAAVYPLMKRVIWWPQAFLGIVFNSSALMGCAAVTGGLDRAALLLYAGCFAWTIGYDTIYAHQDKRDDARIGVKSTALRQGAASTERRAVPTATESRPCPGPVAELARAGGPSRARCYPRTIGRYCGRQNRALT